MKMKLLASLLLFSLLLTACEPDEVYPEPPITNEEHIIGHWIAYKMMIDSTNGGQLVEFPADDSVLHYVFSADTYRMYNGRAIDKTDEYHLTGFGINMGSELPFYVAERNPDDMRWETDIPTLGIFRTFWVRRVK